MSMTKQQTVGAVCGGLFVVCAGALGYFLYDAWSTRTETEEQLEQAQADFGRYNSAAVFPSKKSIADVKSNETSYAEWRAAALDLAARGDKPAPAQEDPSVFKQRLQGEVRRMAALPGGVDGKICAPAFLFGFEQFLGESGVLPQEDAVQRLAVQLDTIAHTVDLFAAAGVYEVKGVTRVDPKKDDDDAPRARNNKKNAKAGADAEPEVVPFEYKFELTARPAAFVKVLNALTADTRFTVVKNLSFKQSADGIVEKIAAVESAKQQAAAGQSASSSRRRRRRGGDDADATPAAQESAKKMDRLVSDPETDAPVQMAFTLLVYDFGRAAVPAAAAEQPAAGAATAEKKEEN